MVEIVLLILKVLGIASLVLLALVLLLLLLILFVPIFYKIQVSYQTSPRGEAVISWLLLALHISYDKELEYTIKIFSKSIGSDKDTDISSDSPYPDAAEDVVKEDLVKREERKQSLAERESQAIRQDLEKGEQEANRQSLRDREWEHIADKQKERAERKKSDKKRQKTKSDTSKVKAGIKDRIQEKMERLKALLANLSDKKDKLGSIWQSQKNKALLAFLWKKTKAILKCLAPKKYRGHIAFGFADPATTGNVLLYSSLLYPWLGRDISIVPDFEEENMDICLAMNGHFGLYYIIYWLLSLFANKEFRKVVEAYRQKKLSQYLLRD